MTVSSSVLTSFLHPVVAADRWAGIQGAGDTREIFLTCQWQRTWWESFGRGELMLVVASRDGDPIALAPMFLDGGMIFFVGSGGSDYLDFVGDVGEPDVLDSILRTARDAAADFIGFRFYHVPETSQTGRRLAAAATRLGLAMFDEGEVPAPALGFAEDAQSGRPAAERQSLLRAERRLRRDGELLVEHFDETDSIRPHLEAFFSQHRSRWAATPYPSLFEDPVQRGFYERLTDGAGPQGWLRFTRLTWNDRPVAFHFGFSYGGSFLWYKPSFDVELARLSPGEVLLRQLLLAARAEGAHTFDFGLGDEGFKSRFSTSVRTVRTWGLYNPDAID